MAAEILQTLDLVDKNYSFQSCASDSQLSCKMFPDSENAKIFEISLTKFMYLIRYGNKPYVKANVAKEIQRRPFTYHFEETMSKK